MDQPVNIHDYGVSSTVIIGFSIIGLIVIVLSVYHLCRSKTEDHESDRRSTSSSIESFQQLYFTKTPYNQLENIDQPIIERWSSINQPALTFYRAFMEDNSDNRYQPITEERLRSAIEQSKAMEYAGVEIIFF